MINKLIKKINSYIPFLYIFNKEKKLKASLSIEASIAMSIFVISVCILFGPFIIIKSNIQILRDMNFLSKTISYAKALEQTISKNPSVKERIGIINNDTLDNIINFTNFDIALSESLKDTIIVALPYNTKVYDDETNIIKYDMGILYKLPFSSFLNVNQSQELISERRAFVGADGARWKSKDKISTSSEIVFISNYASKYHTSKECYYLTKELKSTNSNEIKDIRNETGSTYSECTLCKQKMGIEEKEDISNYVLYYTKYGIRYHFLNNCSRVLAYIKEVYKAEVEDLGLCSACEKREGK
ncbi:MAG: hypothetical protein Q4F88_03175 [Eubacteriales bacterium]|nr:hypothetical protein [Eubacteriales bacterium]